MISNTIFIFSALVAMVRSEQECSFQSDDGAYKASWTYDAQRQRVQFTIEAKQRVANFWTGIGFGNGMNKGDMIIITNNGGNLTISDRHGVGYKAPELDSQQDAQSLVGKVENGVIRATFTRLVNTNDPNDLPLIDPTQNNCQYFMFPVSGGPVSPNGANGNIEQHINTPVTKLICGVSTCTGSGGQQPPVPARNGPTPINSLGEDARRDSVLAPGNASQPTGRSGEPAESGPSTPVNTSGESQPTAQVGSNPAATRPPPPGLPPQPSQPSSTAVGASESSGQPVTSGPPSSGTGSSINPAAGAGGPNTPPTSPTAAGGSESAPNAGSACEYAEGGYKAQWYYNDVTQRLTFTLTAPLQPSRWAGIGFGQQMQGGDMITIQDNNGVLKATDRHGTGHSEPAVDSHQDVENFKGTVNGGVMQATFNRLADTNDKDDLPIDDAAQNNCQYFIFPVSGGNADPQGKLQTHDTTPRVKLICNAKQCKKPAGEGAAAAGSAGTEATPATAGAGAPESGPSAGGVRPGQTGENPVPGGPSSGVPSGPSAGPTQGGAPESRGAACPRRGDHSACRTYIDDYLSVVYSRFPKTDPITEKACGLLATHQEGIVLRECCHYLSSPCQRFIDQYISRIPQGSAGANTAGNSPFSPSGSLPTTSNAGEVPPGGNPIAVQPQPSTPNPNANQPPNAGIAPNLGPDVGPNPAGHPNPNPNPNATPNTNPNPNPNPNPSPNANPNSNPNPNPNPNVNPLAPNPNQPGGAEPPRADRGPNQQPPPSPAGGAEPARADRGPEGQPGGSARAGTGPSAGGPPQAGGAARRAIAANGGQAAPNS